MGSKKFIAQPDRSVTGRIRAPGAARVPNDLRLDSQHRPPTIALPQSMPPVHNGAVRQIENQKAPAIAGHKTRST
jgi:hypothetical protein